MGTGEMKPTWKYKMGNDITSTETKEKEFGVMAQDNLSPEKHVIKIVWDTYRISRNIGEKVVI